MKKSIKNVSKKKNCLKNALLIISYFTFFLFSLFKIKIEVLLLERNNLVYYQGKKNLS